MEKDFRESVENRKDDKEVFRPVFDNNSQSSIKNKKKKNFGALLIIGFIVIILAGVSIFYLIGKEKITPPTENENSGIVKKFEDYNQMEDFLNDINSGVMNENGSGSLGGARRFEERIDITTTKSSNSAGWGSSTIPSGVTVEFNNLINSTDYSTTNVQVAGVDEGDLVKTDGKYIYTIAEKDVVIIEATPVENAKEVSRLQFDFLPSGIYLSGDKLLVYGKNRSYSILEEYKDIIPRGRFQNFSYLKIYDISDRNNPIEKKSYELEGSLSSSRMIGEYVYFITTSQQYSYDEKFPVPIIIENGEVLSSDKTAVNCNCPDVYYFDMEYQNYIFTSVLSLNIKDEDEKLSSEIYLLDGYQNNLFVSENNIYITYNKMINEDELTVDIMMEILKQYIFPELSEKDQERIGKIENADEDILSKTEKINKIMMIVDRYQNIFENQEEDIFLNINEEYEKSIKEKFEDISKELEKTVIHKIEINEGDLKYKTSGEVTGIVLNQFSMDENGGYFRIATTRSRDWSSRNSSQSYSNLYVLDEDLKVVGKVEELAEGERIYSVRFMQNRAYMVTFKQTDPLFVIGLDDPTAPVVLGELKVPGFSSYLHPYDETTLIGLGKESDEKGRITGGVKLSLFDVSDVANPKEIDKFVLGDRSSNSIAINEHKAFLFSKDKNLLVLPVTMQEKVMEIQDPEDTQKRIEELLAQGISEVLVRDMIAKTANNQVQKYFNGVAVFNINKKGFELKGKIDHADEKNNRYYGNNNVMRSLYIGDALYTLSNKFLKANWLDTLKEAKSLKLSDSQKITDETYTPSNPIQVWE